MIAQVRSFSLAISAGQTAGCNINAASAPHACAVYRE